MDILRLFTGLVMLTTVLQSSYFVMRVDAWRSAVSALQLRWEREQRQAAPNGVSLNNRQAVQMVFEQLVTSRPHRMFWMHLFLSVGTAAFVLLLAWNQDSLRWVGLWLVLPPGLIIAAILGYGWMLINQASVKLEAISTSLYGPAPPRVKIRSIRTVDTD